MANEKQQVHISTIQRALGIIEGIASGTGDRLAKDMLYTAVEMIEESVKGITENGK